MDLIAEFVLGDRVNVQLLLAGSSNNEVELPAIKVPRTGLPLEATLYRLNFCLRGKGFIRGIFNSPGVLTT